ncbi:hypothetical protein F2P56_026087 [Juglans regia]|uniref:Ribosomal RNA small subunit methyltransferase H n=2 Tax=Juglans regia TaxID=51240 RepID=A0A2I4GP59_JUGRE|nr:ribosomal RNA small subunit methyltransferase H [Juglans regia]KAF5456622.1 hypothetical protein F2P56_026087 [Juglans regia]
MAKSTAKLFFFIAPFPSSFRLRNLNTTAVARTLACSCSFTTSASKRYDNNRKRKDAKLVVVSEKKRTRSPKELHEDAAQLYADGTAAHIPVMLGEVLDVFSSFSSSSKPLRSFVDCTVGAAGHSAAIIEAHPELKLYVGMDVDPVAHEKARARIDDILHGDSCNPTSDVKTQTILKNFRHIKSVLSEVDEKLLDTGVDGILMDLGMSSMQVNDPERGFSVLGDGPLDMRMDPQASLKAEDILNSWPDTELGRVLREYGEESNWRALQNKIAKARLHGGLHTTGELVDLIQNATPWRRGGRQGWIKTATRVFQALRIAVNDELKTLEDSLYSCFDCLAPGGRLAVISFHSLEDRIVKQTFLGIINRNEGDGDEEERRGTERKKMRNEDDENEAWIRQMIGGCRGIILTKRPITPSVEEERLNRRCRSAKLRVIQKLER